MAHKKFSLSYSNHLKSSWKKKLQNFWNAVGMTDVLGRAHPLIHIKKSSHLLTNNNAEYIRMEAEP